MNAVIATLDDRMPYYWAISGLVLIWGLVLLFRAVKVGIDYWKDTTGRVELCPRDLARKAIVYMAVVFILLIVFAVEEGNL